MAEESGPALDLLLLPVAFTCIVNEALFSKPTLFVSVSCIMVQTSLLSGFAATRHTQKGAWAIAQKRPTATTVGAAVKAGHTVPSVLWVTFTPASRTSSVGTVLAMGSDASGCNARTAVTQPTDLAVLFADPAPPSFQFTSLIVRLLSHRMPPPQQQKEPRAGNLSLHAYKGQAIVGKPQCLCRNRWRGAKPFATHT
jgi:hypothetical protein